QGVIVVAGECKLSSIELSIESIAETCGCKGNKIVLACFPAQRTCVALRFLGATIEPVDKKPDAQLVTPVVSARYAGRPDSHVDQITHLVRYPRRAGTPGLRSPPPRLTTRGNPHPRANV